MHESITGVIERITFHNEDNGYTVVKVRVDKASDLITITGKFVHILEGEQIECSGVWSNNPKYGKQFQADSIRTIPPTSLLGIEKYLASGLVAGIGPHFAKRLVKKFGADVFDIIENQPHRLGELEGIGPKRQQQLSQAWSEQKSIRDIIVFLQTYSIGSSRAFRIYKTYGEQAIQQIKKNPYRLAIDINGIGFKTADQLAMQLGIEKDALIRGYAGIYHQLQTASSNGHCGLPKADLLSQTVDLLSMEEKRLLVALEHLISQGQIIYSNELYCLAHLHDIEVKLAQDISRIINTPLPWKSFTVKKSLSSITLSSSQIRALNTAINNKLTIITGGPGVGKTTLVKSVIDAISTTGCKISLAAPTGRAAKRMHQATGMMAKTIHRLLEYNPQIFGFNRNSDNPLEGDLLIIDEASMIDVKLMGQLFQAIPDSMAVLIVGDIDQLPSVGPGAVLADCIKSDRIPKVTLTEIHRQAAESLITVNAHKINQGLMPHSADPGEIGDFYIISEVEPEKIYQKIITLLQQRIPNKFNLNPIHDIQVLTPMQKGALGAKQLNTVLQKAQNPNLNLGITKFDQIFAPQDKVLQTVNNYEKNTFNGDLGIIERINNKQLIVNFDNKLITYEENELDELQLAYATTIHKSQGSEFPAIIIPITMHHFMLLERNLLYTGITRGKKLVVLIGDLKAIKIACKNQKAKDRNTLLCQRLINNIEKKAPSML
jgi:exodeoxyribonuclease V alpha subunit